MIINETVRFSQDFEVYVPTYLIWDGDGGRDKMLYEISYFDGATEHSLEDLFGTEVNFTSTGCVSVSGRITDYAKKGSYLLDIYFYDEFQGSRVPSQKLQLNLSVVNQEPTCQNWLAPTYNIHIGQEGQIPLPISDCYDADADRISYKLYYSLTPAADSSQFLDIADLAGWLALSSGSAQLSVRTSDPLQLGEYYLYVVLKDVHMPDFDNTTYKTLSVKITNDHAPALVAPGLSFNQTVHIGAALSLQFPSYYIADLDRVDRLAYSLMVYDTVSESYQAHTDHASTRDWLAFNPQTLEISGNTSLSPALSINLTLKIEDGWGKEFLMNFWVELVNSLPAAQVAELANVTLHVGSSLQKEFQSTLCSDADGDAVLYRGYLFDNAS